MEEVIVGLLSLNEIEGNMLKRHFVFGSLAFLAGVFAFGNCAVLADALSPKDTYMKYRAALAKAKEVKEITPFLCKKSCEQINQTPESDKPMMFGFMKETTPAVVQVISEEIKDDHASLKLSGKEAGLAKADSSVKETTEGTVTFVKENGEWKIDKENWNSSIMKN